MNTVELIHAIAGRPGMYIDPASADSVYSFIQGFYFCRSVNGGLDSQDRWFGDNFYSWLRTAHSLEDVATWGGLVSQIAASRKTSPWVTFIGEFERFAAAGGQFKIEQ